MIDVENIVRTAAKNFAPAKSAGRALACAGFAAMVALGFVAMAKAASTEATKVTYEDDVLPIFRDNCLKCHNPDKLKGDLDLTSFSSAVKGGGSGATLNSGDPEGSQLFKSVTHSDEPSMPPNGKLADRDIATIRRWIEGGLLQGASSKALAANKPAVDLSLKSSSIGKPEGPPPLPSGLTLEPVVRSTRASAFSALASSPWAPVVALGGAKQILLHDSNALDYLGVLPFPEGLVCDVKFSRNGKLLVAGGGHGGKSGVVAVWDITTGQRVITVGDQFDSVLAADISADQQRIALGGPDRVLKIYLTKDGSLEHRIKKHTEWVTALEFSPNGKYLVSGDRNGGLVLWETESGQEMFTLVGHKGAISAVTWRADSEMVASASEDGTIKLWKATDGSSLRSITAHAGGVMAARFGHDGKIVSSGRDNKIQVWETNGKNAGTMAFKGDLPTRVTFSDDGRRVIACDWKGEVTVWDAKSGKAVGQLESNPTTVADRVQNLRSQVARLRTELETASTAQAKVEADVSRVKPEKDKLQKSIDETRARLAGQDGELVKVSASVTTDAAGQARLTAVRNEIQTLQMRLTTLQTQLANHAKQAAALNKKAQEAKAVTDECKAKLVPAEASLEKWSAVLETERTDSGPRKVSRL